MRFTKNDEYVRLEAGVATVGVSDRAQRGLGDVVYVDLPPIGSRCSKGVPAAFVESLAGAIDVTCPVAGQVVAVNTDLARRPSLVNEDPEGLGWLFKIEIDSAEPVDEDLAELMDENEYVRFQNTSG